jgi:hypothetical protein
MRGTNLETLGPKTISGSGDGEAGPASRGTERIAREALQSRRWRAQTTPRASSRRTIRRSNAARLERASVRAIAQQIAAAEKIQGDRTPAFPGMRHPAPARCASSWECGRGRSAGRAVGSRSGRMGSCSLAGETATVALAPASGSLRFAPALPSGSKRPSTPGHGPGGEDGAAFNAPSGRETGPARTGPVPTFWRPCRRERRVDGWGREPVPRCGGTRSLPRCGPRPRHRRAAAPIRSLSSTGRR